MKLAFFLTLLISISAFASILSIQTGNDKVYFYFEQREGAEEALQAMCGEQSSTFEEVPKSELEPDLSSPLLESKVRTPLQQLRIFDTNSGYYPFGGNIGTLVNDMNKILDRYEFDRLPSKVYRVEVSSCVPDHVLPLLFKEDLGHTGANCFNSVFNFNQPRTLQFLPPDPFIVELAEDYDPASGAPEVGDIGVIYKAGKPIHAFAVIGENWAYTKNGTGHLHPYRFQRISALRQFYSSSDIRYFSKK